MQLAGFKCSSIIYIQYNKPKIYILGEDGVVVKPFI